MFERMHHKLAVGSCFLKSEEANSLQQAMKYAKRQGNILKATLDRQRQNGNHLMEEKPLNEIRLIDWTFNGTSSQKGQSVLNAGRETGSVG